jgi:predicted DsbA family dithiol-disulfide isomerase
VLHDYDVDVEWKPYEIHPDTPLEGWVDPGVSEESATELRLVRALMGSAGPAVRLPPVVANSHLALEAAEYARDHGRFDAFHRQVFAAYFGEGLNIGRPEVLRKLGDAAGLDGQELVATASAHRYHDRLNQVQREKRWYGLYGTPTFIIANQRIAGAQPYAVLSQALERIGARRHAERPFLTHFDEGR